MFIHYGIEKVHIFNGPTYYTTATFTCIPSAFTLQEVVTIMTHNFMCGNEPYCGRIIWNIIYNKTPGPYFPQVLKVQSPIIKNV